MLQQHIDKTWQAGGSKRLEGRLWVIIIPFSKPSSRNEGEQIEDEGEPIGSSCGGVKFTSDSTGRYQLHGREERYKPRRLHATTNGPSLDLPSIHLQQPTCSNSRRR